MQFEFTEEQIVHIVNILAERPFKEVAQLMQHIQQQVVATKTPNAGQVVPLKAS